MPTGIRLKRIQDQILQVITIILETKVNDPRIAGAYVTDVSVDRELDYADIYISSLAGSENADEILEGLRNAAGFIRHALSQEVKLRVMPKLRFYWDETPDTADRIEAILAEIQAERLEKGKEAAESGKPMDEGMNDAGNQSED